MDQQRQKKPDTPAAVRNMASLLQRRAAERQKASKPPTLAAIAASPASPADPSKGTAAASSKAGAAAASSKAGAAAASSKAGAAAASSKAGAAAASSKAISAAAHSARPDPHVPTPRRQLPLAKPTRLKYGEGLGRGACRPDSTSQQARATPPARGRSPARTPTATAAAGAVRTPTRSPMPGLKFPSPADIPPHESPMDWDYGEPRLKSPEKEDDGCEPMDMDDSL
ncbi:uncharacterized protein LOC135812809 [Sycon ciliatum]|uniref:uncharacterized protein LOC135812809 n=1 Tax=Sycon ciliatum TaxID=27933 RepID=UPI0031F703DE